MGNSFSTKCDNVDKVMFASSVQLNVTKVLFVQHFFSATDIDTKPSTRQNQNHVIMSATECMSRVLQGTLMNNKVNSISSAKRPTFPQESVALFLSSSPSNHHLVHAKRLVDLIVMRDGEAAEC